MLPKRKISKCFRERKVPNIEFDTNFKAVANLENMVPHPIETSNFINIHSIKVTNKRDHIFKFDTAKEKSQKSSIIDMADTNTLQHIRKMQLELQNDCFLTNQKQVSQPNQNKASKNRTMKSEDNSMEKFVESRADKFNSSNKKTDLANKILQSIEASINSTCRSMSAMSKEKVKRKRMIEECKVVKVPWKSTKKEFRPEVSMIRKNSSRAPMDSLRQIYENLN